MEDIRPYITLEEIPPKGRPAEREPRDSDEEKEYEAATDKEPSFDVPRD